MLILVTVLHLSVVPYFLGYSPDLISLPTEWRDPQPQPGFFPKPQTHMASCLLDASTRMPSGAHMPHVHILALLSASLSFQWPKVQPKGSYNGGMGYSKGSMRLWEPRKGTDPTLAVREGFLGWVFGGTFQWSL